MSDGTKLYTHAHTHTSNIMDETSRLPLILLLWSTDEMLA